MDIGVKSDIGNRRDMNQDSYYLGSKEDIPLFIIADGMGGHKAGEVASEMAISIIKEKFLKEKENLEKKRTEIALLIKNAIEEANSKILQESIENKECRGMGTTITMAYILVDKLFIGHIGDSRAYLLRKNDFVQLTEDHSLVAQLVKNGSISKEEAQCHPQKNIITRAVGTDSNIEIDIIIKDIDKEDIILFCTDGLTNMVGDSKIKEILLTSENMQAACEDLVNIANENGGLDNITVMAVKFV